jgi:hypothetical protein
MSSATIVRAQYEHAQRCNPPVPTAKTRWERAVPVYGVSVVNKFFIVLVGLAVLSGFLNRSTAKWSVSVRPAA